MRINDYEKKLLAIWETMMTRTEAMDFLIEARKTATGSASEQLCPMAAIRYASVLSTP